MSSVRVEEVVTWDGSQYFLEHRHEFASSDFVAHLVLVNDGGAEPSACEANVDRGVVAEDAARTETTTSRARSVNSHR
ncbi:MAG: hypothetical protein M3037_11670 [Gemmatimonadota bacterium]|nr:hypothetical protein [Gemmatimonadota bacterium]